MRHPATLLACVCLLALAAPPFASAATQASGEPATWITRDVEIKLQNLPETYTCDDLWYKLHGILLAIGARQYMSITPYNCGPAAARGGRSPTLDLKFQVLRTLSGANVKWAETTAVNQVVRLGPGEPKILGAGDCALLAQLEGTLFSYLGMNAVPANLECSAARGGGASHFGLSVEVLTEEPAHAAKR